MPNEKTNPIILAHGIAPFDRAKKLTALTNDSDDRFNYFRKIKSTLQEAGFSVSAPNVDFAAGVEKRAANLKAEVDAVLEKTGAPKVHIIAHSMGGLDARWMIAKLGGQEKVSTLTTIGTPHNGSPLADFAVGGSRIGSKIVDAFLAIGIDLTGFYDLTTDASTARNRILEPIEIENGVTYRTWGGRAGFWSTFAPLKMGHLLLKQTYNEPENDGLVPLASALWKEEYNAGVLPWDHFNQTGWWHPDRLAKGDTDRKTFENSVRTFYLDIANQLSNQQG